MTRRKQTVEVLEQGDLFLFYRPRLGIEEVKGREDIQRLYMITAAQRAGRRLFRLFVIGRKKLPEILPEKAHPEERSWAMVALTTTDPEEIRRELRAKRYVTATRGERILPAAKPVGEGRYQLVKHGNHTELAYVLELPERPGPAQEEFEIKKEASYIIAVKNPDLPQPPGITAPREQPSYPERLKEKFGKHRWIPVDDPELRDYPHTQVLLLGAHAGPVEEELGIEIEEEHETVNSAEIFRLLHLNREEIPLEPLFEGKFPEDELPPPGAEIEELPPEEAPGRGGRVGGKAAATRAASAAALAKVLGGITFPRTKQGLIQWAKRHRGRLEQPEPVFELLSELPDREYTNMADVERALGEIR
jgi:hypothetical protein